MAGMTLDTCSNCGRSIGKLETPFLYQEHIVCCECYTRLSPQEISYASAAAAPPRKSGGVRWLIAVFVIAAVASISVFVVSNRQAAKATVTSSSIPTFLDRDDVLNYIQSNSGFSKEQLSDGLDAKYKGQQVHLFSAQVTERGAHNEGVLLTFEFSYPRKRIINGNVYSVDGGAVYLDASQTPQAQVLSTGSSFSATGELDVGIADYSDKNFGVRLYLRHAKFD